MPIKSLEKMTEEFSNKGVLGFTLFDQLVAHDYPVCDGQFSFKFDGKTKTVQFINDVKKVIVGYFHLKSKLAFIALDANGDLYLVNKSKPIESIDIMLLLEKTSYNSIVLNWYKNIFSEIYHANYVFNLNDQVKVEFMDKGFSISTIEGLNASLTVLSKPILRKYSIVVHQCVYLENSISYILEDKKKKLVFFFKTPAELTSTELAKMHKIDLDLITYTPKISPYYALA